MSEVKLLPHNEVAYKKLVECLKENQMAAINHATGTGKSFILLKFLNDYKDKKILYIAPTYPIIDQLIEDHTKELGIDINEFEQLDTCIYASLLKEDMDEFADEYDIIILDEYHRCGAPKWGEKVNQLLENIKTKYPNKKVIGTTATEIRFLDNEKNMNNILFDGVCASRLSLADAILEGILPIPVYINAIYGIYDELDRLEKTVKTKCFYTNNINKYLNEISKIRELLDEAVSQITRIDNYIDEEGKYLVFSSNISNIEKDKEVIRKIFKGKVNCEYEVHSDKTRKQNKIELDKFKRVKGANSFLYSVNVLNEGLHVKDIDAIFMLRKTTSPIIYFQQLGRLISSSKRKKDVIVFDLVNNMKNHPFIYMLYEDLYKRANELMKEKPEEKERYQEVLDRFKVVNLTSNICELLDRLSEKIVDKELKRERLETAILILEGKLPASKFEYMQAKVDIYKLKTYIDKEHFRRIKKLDIEKPKIFDLEEDEYEVYLKSESFKQNFDRANKDDNLTIVSNEQLFTKTYERVLKKVESELKNYKNEAEYIQNLYLELIKFIKQQYRQPKLQLGGKDREHSKFNYEIELFYKKIIFYSELKERGYIDKLQELDNIVNKNIILSEFMRFTETHNGEFPTNQVSDKREINLCIKFNRIEQFLDSSDIELLKHMKEKQDKRVREVVLLYVEFIKKYKRYPLIKSQSKEEAELAISYVRNKLFFTESENEKIKETYSKINKKSLIQNSYTEMIKNRK